MHNVKEHIHKKTASFTYFLLPPVQGSIELNDSCTVFFSKKISSRPLTQKSDDLSNNNYYLFIKLKIIFLERS